MRRSILQISLLAILTLWLCSGQTATQPATCPVATTTISPAPDPAVMQILKDLETAGGKYKTIRSDVRMEVIDRLTGDIEERTGWVVYQKSTDKEPSKFRVHFDTRKLGNGPTTKQKDDWAFDGQWLTVVKHSIKDMVRLQVVAEGEQYDPMKLGQGPFLLPFGQKAQEVLKYYVPTTRELAENEPEGTTYLHLKTRRNRYKEMKLKWAEMWIDPKTHLPVKLVSRDKKNTINKVTLTKTQTDVEIDPAKMFHIPKPSGYSYKVEPLQK